MRVFLAFGLPDEVRSVLDAEVAPLRARHPELNWTPAATWHVTLAFVGEVAAERVDEVVAATKRGSVAAPDRVELRIDGTGRFGQRVGWLRVADRPAGAVATIGGALQAELAGAGLPVDAKEVRPHVTLVRARGKGRLPAGLVDELPTPARPWEVSEVTVYRSHLGPGPLTHEVLDTVALGRA